MKLKYTITTLAALSFALLSSCGDKEAPSAEDHSGHDHGKADKEDHSGHDHGAKGEDHSGHDHSKGGHEDHSGHDHGDAGHAAIKAGPNKGRMISELSPQAEFLAREDKHIQITFYDKAMQQVAPTTQIVEVLTGNRSAPIEMTFTQKGHLLVSDQKLPSGNNFPTVVAIKNDSSAEEVVTKFTLNLTSCPSCKNQEYACECQH